MLAMIFQVTCANIAKPSLLPMLCYPSSPPISLRRLSSTSRRPYPYPCLRYRSQLKRKRRNKNLEHSLTMN